MTPIITAIVGAAVVLTGALVARGATRYAAELAAAQRRRDAELAHLNEFRDALIDTLAHLSVYRYALSRVAPHVDEADRFDQAIELLELTNGREDYRFEVAGSLERLRNMALGLPWHELRDAFRPLGDLIDGVDSPHAVVLRVDRDDRVLQDFVVALARHQRHLFDSYPIRSASGRCGR